MAHPTALRSFSLALRRTSPPPSRGSITRPLSDYTIRFVRSHLRPSHPSRQTCRFLHASASASSPPPQRPAASSPPPSSSTPRHPTTGRPPATHNRGPTSSETTQTDFSVLDVLGATPPPATGVDSCLADGFALNNGAAVHGSGVLMVGGEAFRWAPWRAGVGEEKGVRGRLLNERGQWEVGDGAWGLLDVVWPKPDLLIIGTGARMAPLAPATREAVNTLGIRVEVQDTRNAAAQYNLLATERGAGQVAAALVPVGWRDGGA